ncbi:MAG: hypothetical protein LBM25_03635 [Bacteroidales bacterium]|jgi:uncharacterized protein involved in exopolysaccharide biosynthesis|nr:hypothetical protein [Bacteroidales bacterium]
MDSNKNKDDFNLKNAINFIVKHFLALAITFIVSTIVIGGLSLLLPNYYKSQVTLIPADSNAVSKAVLSQMDNYDVLSYGKEKNTEYILELINSSTVISKTIEKFELDKHYGIEKEEGQQKSDKLNQRLVSNIKAKRTDNLGVKITVWDKDPFYAANIANYMVEQMQVLRNDMKKAKMDSIVSTLIVSNARLRRDIDILADSLSVLAQQSKMLDPEKMSDRLSQELAKQIAVGNQGAISRLENKLAQISKDGPKIIEMKVLLERKTESLRIWEEKLEQVRVDAQSNIPVDFIVDTAYPSQLKDKPKRSIIAIVGGLCCMLLALFVLILKDNNKA